MKTASKLPTTLVMCVCNEEEIIEDALRSAVDYVSEIVVVHDGPCSDSTGKIVEKYGGKFIETEKNMGVAEFVRIKAELASQEYILQLDADEALNEELQDVLADAVVSDVDFATVNWLHYRRGKEIRTLIQRHFLFKKNQIYFLACPQESVRPKKGAITKHYDAGLFNDAEDRYKDQEEIDKKQLEKQAKWVPPHARTLVNFNKVERFNTTKDDRGSLYNELLSSKIYLFHGYITIPLVSACSTIVSSIKNGTNPFLLFSELPIHIKYYSDLTREIRKLKGE